MENHEIVYEGKIYELVENTEVSPCHNCDLKSTEFYCRDYNTKCSEQFVYKLKKKEEDMKDIFTVTIDSKEYSVKPFNLIDIYMKDPDKDWFVNLMKEWDEYDYTPFLNIIDEYDFDHFNFQDNLQWMIDNGFIEEIVKATLLEQGMTLTRDSGAEYMCIDEDEDGFRLVCIKRDRFSLPKGGCFNTLCKTLQEIQDRFDNKLYIKEEKENR